MSSLERNKGVLKYTGIDTEGFSEEDFETYSENGFMVVDGEIYEVEYEVKGEENCGYFTDIQVDHDTGDIYFHTMHYNGGAGLEEVIEWAYIRGLRR